MKLKKYCTNIQNSGDFKQTKFKPIVNQFKKYTFFKI